LLHGDSDITVPISASKRLFDVAKEIELEFISFQEIEEMGHSQIMIDLMRPTTKNHHRLLAPLLDIIQNA
jgi:hypothetical protein